MYINTDERAYDLNLKQIEAVNNTEGPLLVLAGAGTGKTKVLTNRIAHIIQQNLAATYQILAVTFTNKAANEMRARVNKITNADGLHIGTFHSIAARILRDNIHLLDMNLNQKYSIIDQDDQIKLIKNIAVANDINVKNYQPKLLHIIISKWKDQNLLPNDIRDNNIQTPVHKIAHNIYHQYQARLQDSNVVDFGDLLLYCNQLFLTNKEILKAYQDKFKYILVDEYQDTNTSQYLFIRILAQSHKNICCVGDDDQSIYSWRGADINNILRFEKDFTNAKIIKLEQNYRSSSHILSAASDIIMNNCTRHVKKLWTENNKGEKIKIVSCWNDREEARFVITEIKKHTVKAKYKLNQIAILVRAGFQTRSFEEVLISNAMPYQIIGGLRFYERMEIRDLLAYIRLALNNNDNLALERIINVPRRSIGNVTLKKMKDYAINHKVSVFNSFKMMLEEKIFSAKAQDALTKFVQLIDTAGEKYKSENASDVTNYILRESGYLSALKEEKTDESKARIENINEMLKAINEFDNIYEFIEHSSLVMDNEALESDFGGTIKIMTLHAAKGLEFDLVFLPGWEEGIFPHQKSLNEEGKKGLEEERRIAYVGITRARQELYITYAESRRMYAEIINSRPSRFLSEISDDNAVRYSSGNKLNYISSKHNFSMQTYSSNSPLQSGSSNVKDYSKHLVAKGGSNNVTVKQPGQKINHKKFGSGIIVRKIGDNLEIAFEKIGLKTLKEEYVEEV